jgi:hypothetical protein
MTAARLIRLLLEFDAQVVGPRPSDFGRAAVLVARLCEHAEPSLRSPATLGDWRAVDLTAVGRPAPVRLDQPILDAILAAEGGDTQ